MGKAYSCRKMLAHVRGIYKVITSRRRRKNLAISYSELAGRKLPCTEDGSQRSSKDKLLSFPPIIKYTKMEKTLKWFGHYLCKRFENLPDLSPKEPGEWIRSVDNCLLEKGWQAKPFLTSGSVVFLYMLCRDILPSCIRRKMELKNALLVCLYVTYLELGHESSYSPAPFLEDTTLIDFWKKGFAIATQMNTKIIRFTTDPEFCVQVFQDLWVKWTESSRDFIMSKGVHQIITKHGY